MEFRPRDCAHEYGHGISTRLVGGRNQVQCLLSQAFEEQMGEGWSDFWTYNHCKGDTEEQENRNICTISGY
jgi:hypothetical protein